MTTKYDYQDRIKYHKIEAKPNNIKFDIIRRQTDRPWKYGLLNQWQKPFNDSNEGLKFLAPYEQYYIKRFNTYQTTYGLNNSIGGDYSGWSTKNTSGILGVFLRTCQNSWVYTDPYDPKRKPICQNQSLPFLLYQMKDQYKIEPIILDEKKYKNSLKKSNELKKLTKYQHYYCGSPNITIGRSFKNKKYVWRIFKTEDNINTTRINTFNVIKDYGYLIYTPILFAYQAIGLENEWLIDNYTVDQSNFMPFNEFEKKYTIKDNDKLIKVIQDNIV